MPLPRKPGPAQSLRLVGQIPNLPSFPEDVSDRFNSLQQYEAQMQDWWRSVQAQMQDHRDQIQSQFTATDNSTSQTLTKIDAELATLQNQLSMPATSADVRKVADTVSASISRIRQVLKAAG